MEIYSVNLRIQSEYRKYGPEKTAYLDTFHEVDSINAQDKLAKMCPLTSMLRGEFMKIESEEYNSVDEKIIPSKTKYSSIRQYSSKKPKKGAIQKSCPHWHLWFYV